MQASSPAVGTWPALHLELSDQAPVVPFQEFWQVMAGPAPARAWVRASAGAARTARAARAPSAAQQRLALDRFIGAPSSYGSFDGHQSSPSRSRATLWEPRGFRAPVWRGGRLRAPGDAV